jgi:hypothetical protein
VAHVGQEFGFGSIGLPGQIGHLVGSGGLLIEIQVESGGFGQSLKQLLIRTGGLNDLSDRITQDVKLGIFLAGDGLFAEKRQYAQGFSTGWTKLVTAKRDKALLRCPFVVMYIGVALYIIGNEAMCVLGSLRKVSPAPPPDHGDGHMKNTYQSCFGWSHPAIQHSVRHRRDVGADMLSQVIDIIAPDDIGYHRYHLPVLLLSVLRFLLCFSQCFLDLSAVDDVIAHD